MSKFFSKKFKISVLKKKGYQLIGVSADSVKRQKNFSDKNELPFDVIADENRNIIDQFQLIGVSDAEAKIAAKQIAMGKKTIAEYTTDLQQIAPR